MPLLVQTDKFAEARIFFLRLFGKVCSDQTKSAFLSALNLLFVVSESRAFAQDLVSSFARPHAQGAGGAGEVTRGKIEKYAPLHFAAADAAAGAPESRRARASRRKPNNRQAPGQPLYKRTAGGILVLQSRFSPETALRRMRNRILVLRRSEGARYRPSSGSGSMQCRAGAPPCSEPLRTSGRGMPRAARQTG